jgi:hypothetical protein
VLAAVASAKEVSDRVPARSDPGVVGWVISHQNEWSDAGRAPKGAAGAPVEGLTAVTDHRWAGR